MITKQIDLNTLIANMRALKGSKITFGLSGSRDGTDGTGDSSGVLYSSLNKAGANLKMGNNDTLFDDLEKIGFQRTNESHRYGDIFILGIQSQADGLGGLSGVFLSNKKVISCNQLKNGVSIDDYSELKRKLGYPPETFFRKTTISRRALSDITDKINDDDEDTNNKDNTDNSGEIEEYSYIKDHLCLKGWHYTKDPTKDSGGDDNKDPDNKKGNGKQLAVFPIRKEVTITQGENGGFSHAGTLAVDFAMGEQHYSYYAPFDCKCVYKDNFSGVGWESLEQVKCVDGSVSYVSVLFYHDNNSSNFQIGETRKKGDVIGHSGTGGEATGDHCHMEVSKGKWPNLYKNQFGVWGINNPAHLYDVFSICNNVGENKTPITIRGFDYPWKCMADWDDNGNDKKPTRRANTPKIGAISAGAVNWDSIQSRAQFFISICIEMGIPKNTALALAANAYAESSLDPSALEPNGMGHGYFQWSYPSNWGDVPNHMNRTYEDAKFQINFARSVPSQWINAGYGSWAQFWEGNNDPQTLTMAWITSWERPAVITDRWALFTSVVNVNALNFNGGGDNGGGGDNPKPNPIDENAKAKEIMEIYDALTDKLIKTVDVQLKRREDKKAQNKDVENMEWSGFDFCITFEYNNPFYIQFVKVLKDGTRKVLPLRQLFFPHSSSRKNIGEDYSTHDYFLIETHNDKGEVNFVKDIINGFSYTLEANAVPSITIKVPICEVDKFGGNQDVKIIFYGKMFDGIVKRISLDKKEETATINIDHTISEWENRQIPTNYTVKHETFAQVFCNSPFLYSTDWYIDCDKEAHKEKVNYAFSRQNHLEALNKATSLTHKLVYRVGVRFNRYLEIGVFGQEKIYIISENCHTERHLKIIDTVTIEKEYDKVVNTYTVYGEKSDSSQASLTLREAYLDQQRKGKPLIDGFPIVVLTPTVNREQKQYYTNIAKMASNNSLEYSVIDEFSVNLEKGKIIERSLSMNDVAPFENNGQKISDEERANQSMIAYKTTVKRLINSRRKDIIKVKIGKIPSDLNVLDKVYFDYSNDLELFDGCSRKCKKIYQQSGYFYILSITTTLDNYLNETNELTLCKEMNLYGDD